MKLIVGVSFTKEERKRISETCQEQGLQESKVYEAIHSSAEQGINEALSQVPGWNFESLLDTVTAAGKTQRIMKELLNIAKILQERQDEDTTGTV